MMVCSLCKRVGHNKRTCKNFFLMIQECKKDDGPTISDIPNIIIQETKSRGKTSSVNGKSYEHMVHLNMMKYNYNDAVIIPIGELGGSTVNPDIQFQIDNKIINIEAKNKNSSEGGQKTMHFKDGLLICKDNTTIHSEILSNYQPWSGNIPSFLKGDKSFDTWLSEKKMFKDEYKFISSDVIRKYYKDKNIHYIQIQEKGLYHIDTDVLNIGTPIFDCESKLRIRCKQHGSSSMPSSVQAVFIFIRKNLKPSHYDIDHRLPDIFKKI